jgi:hypothetical protein
LREQMASGKGEEPGAVEMATWGVQEAAEKDREEASKFWLAFKSSFAGNIPTH